MKCQKCRIEFGRCIYGCPFTKVYIKGAVGSEQEGVTVWTDEQYNEFAKRKQIENYGKLL